MGELLDLTFSVYRARPGLFAATGIVVSLLSLGFNMGYFSALRAVTGTSDPVALADTRADPGAEALLVLPVVAALLLAVWVVYHAAAVFVVGAASRVLHERPAPTREVLQEASGRLPSVIGVSLLSGLPIGLGLCCLAVPGVFLWMAWALAVPVAVLEVRGPVSSLGRSWELVLRRGPGGLSAETNWVRMLVVGVVTWIVLTALNSLGSAPVSAATVIAMARGAVPHDSILGPSMIPLWLHLPLQLFGSVIQGAVLPLGLIPWTLVYYDVRTRHEGLDLRLAVEALGAEAP